ncbi:MAG: 2-hydroxy-3-oxopropionate reductase [Rickettsiales bacterium]|nr:2-hydroxy-3-oxopropionate reductase [Rickettsiales bacterium]
MSDRNNTVGFIGMGMMGGGMAANLLKAGFGMVAYDIDPVKNELFAGLGAKIANGPAGVAEGASKVICIVETSSQVRDVVLGDGGIIEGAQEGDIFVCSATVDPIMVRELHDILAEKGIKMLDAPVSGGVPRAESGELSIIVGGDTAVVDVCQPYFKAMSSNIFYMGEIGSGLAMKLCNNMITQVTKVVVAEAMALGTKAGLDPQAMYDVITVSTGNSDSFRAAVPRYLSGDFSPGGTIDISYKDQELETAFAKALGVPMFMAAASQQVYQMARAAGFNKNDGSVLIKLYEDMIGVQLGPRQD